MDLAYNHVMKPSDYQLVLRMDPQLLALVRESAEASDKSPSQFVRDVLAKHFRNPKLAKVRPEGRPRKDAQADAG